MSDHSESLQEYWKWIHNLSPDVKTVVLDCWDETGRPTSESWTPVIQILRTCDTFNEFLPKYEELMSGFDVDEYKLQDDAEMYWSVYLAGVSRIIE